ncbi:MAG TPA: helix-turn-helix domain-containing protein [Gaiellaceae bacterium]|jgi:AcrR family transcriptional regulator|nr:helix-turn-helix domain-containing protein [Gaiellaceae bacterium]
MPKVSQAHLDARRAEILAGARRAFGRWGYEGTTVARLEEEIGLSRGAIFHYFPNKKALFAELAIEVSQHYGSVMIEGGVEAGIREASRENPDWLGVMVETHARLRHDPEFRELMEAGKDVMAPFRNWFAAEQATGRFRQDVDWLELGRFAAIVVNGFALRVLAGEPSDVEATIRLLHDALAPR